MSTSYIAKPIVPIDLFRFADVFPGRAAWTTVAVVFLISSIWLTLDTSLSFDVSSLASMLLPVLMPLFITAYIWVRPPEPNSRFASGLKDFTFGMAFILIAILALRVLNHLMMTLPFPWTDAMLASWDRSIGFDWSGYAHWVADRSWLTTLDDNAYNAGLGVILGSVFIYLLIVGRSHRAKELVGLMTYTGIACMTMAAAFPARGAMFTLGDPSLRGIFGREVGESFVRFLEALRSGDPHTLVFGQMPGLASFPSYHTIIGVLVMYACRKTILWPAAIVYAVVMIPSTLIFGGHYLVDILAGIVLAVGAIIAYRKLDPVKALRCPPN